MPRNNYDCLSPQDFEELVRDLLQAEWGVALEAFKSGRDSGIDLRYSRINEEIRASSSASISPRLVFRSS